jgi:hypothetical protein
MMPAVLGFQAKHVLHDAVCDSSFQPKRDFHGVYGLVFRTKRDFHAMSFQAKRDLHTVCDSSFQAKRDFHGVYGLGFGQSAISMAFMVWFSGKARFP